MYDVAWIALSLVEHIGGKTLRALLAHFDDPQTVLQADVDALQAVYGIGPKIAAQIQAIDLEQVEQDIARWRDAGVSIVTARDLGYPVRLRDVDDAPPTLYLCGRWQHEFDRALAIVGTRNPSEQAVDVAHRLGMILAERGYTVISGLALGVDTAAHRGALEAGGDTVAVLGSGVLNVYPEENRELAEAIMVQGALLSEVQPFAMPKAAGLVARNRIISGLCTALIVVETGIDGGAMHAARRAREQGRGVYALDIAASGNRALLNDGAQPVAPDLLGIDRLFV